MSYCNGFEQIFFCKDICGFVIASSLFMSRCCGIAASESRNKTVPCPSGKVYSFRAYSSCKRHLWSSFGWVYISSHKLDKKTGLISGFRRDGDEICGLLGYYVASCGNCVPTFRDNVKMGPICCPETSVNNYHTTPRITLEDSRFRR